ncbi:hypothetical protein DY023_08635 [Microbacterium bovistercoris]|uniref:Uncharacterized protein n=1 Tax=Microbacterium bovistercoris TaxID=2293570 RepID=A0A371NUR2_9MICO|nr:hypothetical protein [Microbacterium bovistercoris]REJ05985.1 hypothetical protein DY023_08635 [Microbacterium bovistercoris]
MVDEERQHVVRVPGSRRAKLTPAPDTWAEPDERDRDAAASDASGDTGPNDERMRREVPPHY